MKRRIFEDMNFEEGNKRLQEIAKKLESGNLSIEESVKLFEEGVEIAKECNEILANAKGKITILKKDIQDIDDEIEG